MGTLLSKNREYSLLEFEEREDIFRENIELISYRHINSDVINVNLVIDSCSIPDDIWLRIFLLLPFEERVIISRVCRKWNQLCRDSTFWRTLDFRMCRMAENITDDTVRAVTSYSAAIQIVDLSGEHCKSITDTSLGYLAKYCPRLRKLNLAGRTSVTNHGIHSIACSCPHIEHLILNKCYKISDKGLKSLRKCSMLTVLSVAYCIKITDKGLSTVAKKCRSLEALNIAGCSKVSDKGVRALGRYCKLLRKIDLKHTTEISIEAIEILVRGAPMLSHVQLGILQDEYRTIAALNIVVDYCKFLEFLSFQHHHNQITAGGRKIVSKKRLGAFVSSLNACVIVH